MGKCGGCRWEEDHLRQSVEGLSRRKAGEQPPRREVRVTEARGASCIVAPPGGHLPQEEGGHSKHRDMFAECHLFSPC